MEEWTLSEEASLVVQAAFIRAAQIEAEAARIRASTMKMAFTVAQIPQEKWEGLVLDFQEDKLIIRTREPEEIQEV